MKSHTEDAGTRGLHNKYRVARTDGAPVDPDAEYFVVRIDNSPSARRAALFYAADSNNEGLYLDLLNLFRKYEGDVDEP